MKSEKLLEAMNDLPEELIAEANTRRRHPLVRIAAVAACLVVLLVGMYPFLQSFQGLGTSDDCYVSDREVIYRQGAIYEVVGTNYTAAMERLALPETITEDLVGEKVDVAPDYGDVYQYAPLAGRNGTAPAALYLLERTDEGHEGEWWYLVFSGFVIGDESVYVNGEWKSIDASSIGSYAESYLDLTKIECPYCGYPNTFHVREKEHPCPNCRTQLENPGFRSYDN